MTQPYQEPDTATLRRILRETTAVTVVGVSANPARPSNEVTRYLIEQTDYQVTLVNPGLDELFDRPVYPSVSDVPGGLDLVTVFRRIDHIPALANEVISVGANTLWLQLGLSDNTVAAQAKSAGLNIVMDHCIEIEHSTHSQFL